MKKFACNLVVGAAYAFAALTTSAQTTAFTYQGFLAAGGAPANGPVDFEFRLYNAVEAGAQQGSTVTLGDVGVTNGLFTVNLDFTATPFDGNARWLDIAVRPGASSGAYTNVAPRQQITSTPYAIRAANFSGTVAASQLTGTISSNNIGAGSITTVMLANGAVGSNQLASGAVTTTALADGAVNLAKLNIAGSLLSTTFTNPTPTLGDYFGWSVAVVGLDKVLIGDPNDNTYVGAAYLLGNNGTLMTTFPNPTPAVGDKFGYSVAAVSADKVLISAPYDDTGATDAGAAYLFSINGTLLTTFTNPTPADFDNFGNSVAAIGSDKVLIGAYSDDTGANNSGAAYLFSTNGTLLTTFTNPTSAAFDLFGFSVAAIGSNKVLIGASQDDTGATDAGAAYLFSTNGTLLTTFINPTPADFDNFGYSMTAVGLDKMLIGSYRADTGATDAGAAYLFRTNGTLLATFTNPTPAVGDFFGSSVAAVGSEKVLIGAPFDDTGATDAGAAYLFGTNGTLLTTVTNPAPADSDYFGNAVAAVGSDQVFVGAPRDNTGAGSAGAAYLFSLGNYVPGLSLNAAQLTGTISSNNIAAGSITTVMLAAGAVGSNQIAAGAVGSSQLATGAVGSNQLATGAVGSNQLAAGAVGSNQLASGAVTTTALAEGAVNLAKLITASNWFFSTTFTNPTPAAYDYFGGRMTAVGSDKVLIGTPFDDTGATDAGIAYLFSTSGTRLTTFTNPTPATNEYFGGSVAAVSANTVLIGARHDNIGGYSAGAVYLFNTNGTLLTTFTSPTPEFGDNFGSSVAALGSDKVLIGAFGDDAGATNDGAAYLFSTNGTLLTTFTNPTPALDAFGSAVAVVGSDKVLIGADHDDAGATDAGVAYLFSTNGTLLTTFINPTPAVNDYFGSAVAAVGSDKVLIGAWGDNTGAPDSGAAYLFSTNGTLLTTFTNPIPAGNGLFGYSVTALGSDKVLTGGSGAAYLLSTNGTLLTTFINPTAAATDGFGGSVAALGNDRVLISATGNDTGATDAGVAYLFGLGNYVPGLISQGVLDGSITTSSLEDGVVTGTKLADGAVTTSKLVDGAVTEAKLAPSIGVWTVSGTNIYRANGNVGIGTVAPGDKLSIRGGALSFHYTGNDVPYVGMDLSPTGEALRIRGNIGGTALNTDYVTIQRATGQLDVYGGVYAHGYITASGNIYSYGNITALGSVCANNGVNCISDRNAKQDFAPVNSRDVLDRVLALPLSTWSYISDPGVKHVGPMAQDFHAAFRVGIDDKSIATVDADGVALAAIQGLNQKVEERSQDAGVRMQKLEAENRELKQRLGALERLVNRLTVAQEGGGR
jgi:hypothetical protein